MRGNKRGWEATVSNKVVRPTKKMTFKQRLDPGEVRSFAYWRDDHSNMSKDLESAFLVIFYFDSFFLCDLILMGNEK